MKKIMFNNKLSLTKAVLEGRKTQTRRIAVNGKWADIRDAAYRIGEYVAVAQSYKDMANEGGDILANMLQDETTFKKEYCGVGWCNAMFTKADLMPHRIKITNIRIERLQDISDEDCLKEGVFKMPYKPPFCLNKDADGYAYEYDKVYNFKHGQRFFAFTEPRTAFAALIDKTCGRGTWDNNPYVFVYEFELIR